jgi:hypothetical protein
LIENRDEDLEEGLILDSITFKFLMTKLSRDFIKKLMEIEYYIVENMTIWLVK